MVVVEEGRHRASAGVSGADEEGEGCGAREELFWCLGPFAQDLDGASHWNFEDGGGDATSARAGIEGEGGGVENSWVDLIEAARGGVLGEIGAAHGEAVLETGEEGPCVGMVHDSVTDAGGSPGSRPSSNGLGEGGLGALVEDEGERSWPIVLGEAACLDGGLPKIRDLLLAAEMEGKRPPLALDLSKLGYGFGAVDPGGDPIDGLRGEDHQASAVQGLFEEGAMLFFELRFR